MDNPMTPRLVELVRELQEASEKLCLWEHSIINTPLGQVCPGDLIDRAATELSRLMAEGGLVGAASPSASLGVRERIARAISKWPCHIDGFHAVGYSTTACERWRATAYAQADEILALIGHDSDCATHNEPAMPNGPCDCSLLQRSEATGSPSNPVDDGAVERAAKALAKLEGAKWNAKDCGETMAGNSPDEQRQGYRDMARAALEAAEPHP